MKRSNWMSLSAKEVFGGQSAGVKGQVGGRSGESEVL